MRRRKNACSAARCSANSRPTSDGFGSAAAMVIHEIPSHLVYESPWSENDNQNFRCTRAGPHPRPISTPGIANLGVSKLRLGDSLSMNQFEEEWHVAQNLDSAGLLIVNGSGLRWRKWWRRQ